MPFKFVGGNEFFGPVTKGIESITAERVLAHGVIGGVRSALQGGKFLRGFLSGAVAKIATPFSTIIGRGSAIGGALASAAVGGTVSIVGGGKFANGALTGAYGYLFNYHLSRNNEQVKNRFDRSRWTARRSLYRENSSYTFVAGDRIAIEASSFAFPPTYQLYFTVLAAGLNTDGTIQSFLSTAYWARTANYSVLTVGNLIPQRVFEAGTHSPSVQWTVSIPFAIGDPHDNRANPMLTIFTPYDPWKQ